MRDISVMWLGMMTACLQVQLPDPEAVGSNPEKAKFMWVFKIHFMVML